MQPCSTFTKGTQATWEKPPVPNGTSLGCRRLSSGNPVPPSSPNLIKPLHLKMVFFAGFQAHQHVFAKVSSIMVKHQLNKHDVHLKNLQGLSKQHLTSQSLASDFKFIRLTVNSLHPCEGMTWKISYRGMLTNWPTTTFSLRHFKNKSGNHHGGAHSEYPLISIVKPVGWSNHLCQANSILDSNAVHRWRIIFNKVVQ